MPQPEAIPSDARRGRPLVLFATVFVAVAVGCTSDPGTADESDPGVSISVASEAADSTDSTAEADSSTTVTVPVDPQPAPLIGRYRVEVVAEYPHDPTSYTQGLEWHDGRLLESSGQYGESSRRWVDVATAEIDTEVALADDLFGEGLTIVGDDVLQLTWREGQLLRSSVDDLELVDVLTYAGEGWGLCFDGEQLIRSDGSATLAMHDPVSFAVLGTIEVVDSNGPLAGINELECVGDQVLANVYGLDTVVVIDPATGSTVGAIDASTLRPDDAPAGDFDYLLNGIAHRPDTGTYFLTGKYWSTLYEVRIVRA